MKQWRLQADSMAHSAAGDRLQLRLAISHGLLDQLVVSTGPDVGRQAANGSAQQLRYGTKLKEPMDPAAGKINWEYIGNLGSLPKRHP